MNKDEQMAVLDSIAKDYPLTHAQRTAIAWAVARTLLRQEEAQK